VFTGAEVFTRNPWELKSRALLVVTDTPRYWFPRSCQTVRTLGLVLGCAGAISWDFFAAKAIQ
jgi:hypothetical protein